MIIKMIIEKTLDENLQKMVSRYHYEKLPRQEKLRRRDEYLRRTGMSIITFYRKLRTDTFRPLEAELFNRMFDGK